MARKQKHEEHVNHERWLVSYADFITLLFATFTALYAISNADMDKFRKLQASIKMAFAEGPSCVMKGTPVDSSVQAKGGADPQGNLVISIFSPDYSSNQWGGDEDEDGMGDGDEDGFGDGEEAGKEDPFNGISMYPDDPENEDESETTEPTPTPTPSPTPGGDEEPFANASEGMGDPEKAAGELKKMLQEAGLKDLVAVRQESRGTVISLSEAAFFATGGLDVMTQSRVQLDRIIKVLRNRAYHIRVEGHTDNIPVSPGRPYRNNGELSIMRAQRVVDYMLREFNFPGNMISVAGYGEYRPVAENETPEGRRKNQRVDIVILNDEEVAKEP